MAFFYCRDNVAGVGAATLDGGRYASIQTGDWDTTFTTTAEYYVSKAAAHAATTPPVAGDVVICSHIHDHNYATSTVVTHISGVTYISVDDTAMDVELAGAADYVNSGAADLTLTVATGGRSYHKGMDYQTSDNLTISGVESHWNLKECVLRCLGSSATDTIGITSDGLYAKLIDTDIQLADVAATIGLNTGGGSVIEIDGGSLLIASATKPLVIFSSAGVGGTKVTVRGFDASNLSASGNLCDIATTSDDNAFYEFHNCTKPSGAGLSASTLLKPGQRATAFSTRDGNQYYGIEIDDFYGTVIEETTKVRTSESKYDGTNEISLLVTPVQANCIAGVAGLVIPLLSKYKDLTTAQTASIFIMIDNTTVAATALTDHDIQVRFKVTNTTNQALGDWVAPTPTSILKTATALVTETGGSSNWEGEDAGAYAKFYEITYDLGAIAGVTNGLVEAEVEVMTESLHANDEIYISPEFTLTNT